MMEDRKDKSAKSSDVDGQDLESIIKQFIELIMELLGLKKGKGSGKSPGNLEAADYISQEDMGKQLASNSENLNKLDNLLSKIDKIPGATSLAAKMAERTLKPYLDRPEVKNALNDKLGDNPGGDEIRSELAKYPNICKMIDKVAKNTNSKELGLATQSPAAEAKTEADDTSSLNMTSLANTTGNLSAPFNSSTPTVAPEKKEIDKEPELAQKSSTAPTPKPSGTRTDT